LLIDLLNAIDIGEVLRAVTVPTLIVHRVDDPVVPFSQARAMADLVPGSQLVELEGADHWIFSGDTTRLLDTIETFVTGVPTTPQEVDRSLTTLLVVDIVSMTGSTPRDLFEVAAVTVTTEHRGVVAAVSDRGLLATFDGPGRAVRAAAAVRDVAEPLGVTVRCGVHTAEIERRGDDIVGVGVQIAESVADAAGPREILVSRTVTDLVAGTGLRFADRGSHELEGLDQPWTLYAAAAQF
jgi:class 3 adenylate cyclase